MARRPYDPLAFVPSPDVIREKLLETLTLAERLRLLLDFSERLRLPLGLNSAGEDQDEQQRYDARHEDGLR